MAFWPRASAATMAVSPTSVFPEPVGADTTTESPSNKNAVASFWNASRSCAYSACTSSTPGVAPKNPFAGSGAYRLSSVSKAVSSEDVDEDDEDVVSETSRMPSRIPRRDASSSSSGGYLVSSSSSSSSSQRKPYAAPRSNKQRVTTASTPWYCLAMSRGVLPESAIGFRFAPASIRLATHSALPASAAPCTAVQLESLARLGFAPNASSSRTARESPSSAETISCVSPLRSGSRKSTSRPSGNKASNAERAAALASVAEAASTRASPSGRSASGAASRSSPSSATPKPPPAARRAAPPRNARLDRASRRPAVWAPNASASARAPTPARPRDARATRAADAPATAECAADDMSRVDRSAFTHEARFPRDETRGHTASVFQVVPEKLADRCRRVSREARWFTIREYVRD